MRIGHGYDVHQLVHGRKLILGGLEIDYEKGLIGHSDADVLLHAISDSILGAAGLGDIGFFFPDNKTEFKNISSLKILKIIFEMINQKKLKIMNIDSTIIAQSPKLMPYILRMKINIANVCNIKIDEINIKATTEEYLGFTGSGDGIAAHAICLLSKN